MFRAVIIDDELAGINSLKLMIGKLTNEIKVVATASEPEKGIDLINDYKPEIVFLDISMPGMNGFELLRRVGHKNFKLIFTTAHEEYAVEAIRNKAVDYLLKPLDADELKACIDNLLSESNEIKETLKFPGLIELSVKDGIIFIRPHDIVRLEAAGSYTRFHLVNSVKHLASRTLKEYEQLLDPNLFYRCHNSHIVNLTKVVKLLSREGLFVQMSDGSLAEVARRNKDAFIERLKNMPA